MNSVCTPVLTRTRFPEVVIVCFFLTDKQLYVLTQYIYL